MASEKALSADIDPAIASGSRNRSLNRFYADHVKRVFDIVFCLIVLPIVVPLILVLAVLVMRDGGRPFFGHERIGRNGRPFRCLKLRTMVPDAAERLAAHLAEDPAAREEWAATQKLQNDPRVTKLGGLLRRTSLDELPQFLNVLAGHMSIVGPRPIVPDEFAHYGTHGDAYLLMRPGVTGLWQVTARQDPRYSKRVHLDRRYRRKVSFVVDTVIILRTAIVMLRRTGI